MLDQAKYVRNWPSAVVFDLDGTLVDSAGDLAASLNELLAAEHLSPFPVEEVIQFIGNGITALVQRAFMARGVWLEADELSVYVSRFVTLYGARAIELTRPFAGVLELIADLRTRGIAIGICTNKEQGLTQSIVDRLGWRSYFSAVVGGLPGRPEKPSPIPLLETIASLGASPAQSIMVGDSAIDLHCARNACVQFIGVTFGYGRPPMSDLGAAVTIASYKDFDAACVLLGEGRP